MNLLGNLTAILMHLSSKGQDVNHRMILNTVLRKFDNEIQLKALERREKLSNTSEWTWSLLQKHQSEIFELRERVERSQGTINRKMPTTPKEKARPMAPCIYCKRTNHRSADCKTVPETERAGNLRRTQLCHNCGKPNHKAEDCRSQGCYKCGKKHHSSLCKDVSQPTTERNQNAHARWTQPRSEQTPIRNQNQSNQRKKGRGSQLTPGQETNQNVVTYLPVEGSSSLRIKTFGSNQSNGRQHRIVHVNLIDKQGQVHKCELFDSPVITSRVNAPVLSPEDIQYIKQSKLNLPPQPGNKEQPQILLGCEYLWEIMEGKKYKLPSGLHLISTKFDYAASSTNTGIDTKNCKNWMPSSKKQLEQDILERVPEKPPQGEHKRIHFLSYQIITTPEKKTTPKRIVFDVSAHAVRKPSLNDMLHQGPLMLPNLLGILMRFRTGRIATTADIEKAFLQVRLHEEDRAVTRFLWVKDLNKPPYDHNIVTLRSTRVTLGLNSSPFLLPATIDLHLDTKSDDQDVANQIRKNLALGRKITDEGSLSTILAEIEGCLNSRPLTYLEANPEDFAPIRPIDSLQNRLSITYNTNTDEGESSDPDFHPHDEGLQLHIRIEADKALKSTCEVVDKFWKIWNDPYLTSLREQHKRDLQQGRTATMSPRLGWKLAKPQYAFWTP
ncbi:zinc knuckle [Ancylostoma duodenale]|uniref:Zinc knuckle n=1 Tax=Ancylostoma duodenale TaxID=51022 RepID=A0A0C2FZE2_9BILA|nr:zinc knuckle [Ancylostoma duodenale]